MKPEERAILVLTHLLTIIPLWGLLVASLVWLYYKEKSRAVVFQAQQAVFYHMILLAGLSVGILFHLFCSIVTGLSESLAEMLTLGNYVLMIVFAAVLLCGCIIAAWKVSEGKEFTYPFIGKKLKEEEKE